MTGTPRRPPSKASKFRRPRRKVCMFCADHLDSLDYKAMGSGRFRTRLINDRGKIVPRRTTGTCARHQRMVTEAAKRARDIAILPFVVD